MKKSDQLFNKQWLIGKQHLLLEDLILGRTPPGGGAGGGGGGGGGVRQMTNLYCTRFSSFESRVQFIESYKLLGHNDYYVAEFLKALREKPRHLASLIVRGERMSTLGEAAFSCAHLIAIVFQSLYGNCVLVQDEFYCLQLLNNLIELQFSSSNSGPEPTNELVNNVAANLVSTSPPPPPTPPTSASNSLDLRRLIRKQSCSFNVLFKLYTSFSHSTQLFLTAAL